MQLQLQKQQWSKNNQKKQKSETTDWQYCLIKMTLFSTSCVWFWHLLLGLCKKMIKELVLCSYSFSLVCYCWWFLCVFFIYNFYLYSLSCTSVLLDEVIYSDNICMMMRFFMLFALYDHIYKVFRILSDLSHFLLRCMMAFLVLALGGGGGGGIFCSVAQHYGNIPYWLITVLVDWTEVEEKKCFFLPRVL